MPSGREPSYDAIYVAVLPFYRQECIDYLVSMPGSDVRVFAGKRHVDSTITTGITANLYTRVNNVVVGNRFIFQFGHWREAINAKTTILDLNPRSFTAWSLLVLRKIARRRTLLWGHLHPRAGGGSRTAILRRTMRRWSSGTVLYGYEGVLAARKDLPHSPVWVAPNSIYGERKMALARSDRPYTKVVYVGRLVPEKKVDLLIRAFALSGLHSNGVRLSIMGDGSDRERLVRLTADMEISDFVDFHGHETRPDAIARLYDDALCSVSPGYVGLSLTQSNGFGVPMLVARDEPHSPEIELERFGGVSYFDSDKPESLAIALSELPRDGESARRLQLNQDVIAAYSAETMARGLHSALTNVDQNLGGDGWPIRK
jgi:glycosyltransferase involved in cell wall biosynthesis